MSYSNDGKNAMLDHLATVATKMRLLDDASAEIVDHLDASQDKTIAWDPAATGQMGISASIEFQVKAGVTVGGISFRSTDGLTEYALDTLAVGDQETYANDGTYTVTAATLSITDV